MIDCLSKNEFDTGRQTQVNILTKQNKLHSTRVFGFQLAALLCVYLTEYLYVNLAAVLLSVVNFLIRILTLR